MLNFIMLNVVMLSVVMLSVIMLSVVMMSVVAPLKVVLLQKLRDQVIHEFLRSFMVSKESKRISITINCFIFKYFMRSE
jgi:hypothetical protein